MVAGILRGFLLVLGRFMSLRGYFLMGILRMGFLRGRGLCNLLLGIANMLVNSNLGKLTVVVSSMIFMISTISMENGQIQGQQKVPSHYTMTKI